MFRPFNPLVFLILFVQRIIAQDWCSAGSNTCDSIGRVPSDLGCGFCRSWTFFSNIANNKLRMLGLDGGATASDGDPSNTYMVSAPLDRDFDLTDGAKWRLDLLPDSVPNVKGGALWSNPDNSTIFAYGGRAASELDVPSSNDIPQLDTADDKWTVEQAAIQLNRLTNGAPVNVPELGKAFYIGGWKDPTVVTDAPDDGLQHFAQSVAVFDTKGKSLSLVDAPFLPVQNGAAFYIPVGEGLLVYFGGEVPSSEAQESSDTVTANDWSNVWIYDIEADEWFEQPTTDAPSPRSEFCGSVMYDADTKSWQIWAIGGADPESNEVLNTVSILSIPSFQWFTAEDAAVRMSISCANVGPQIFVIGGRTENSPGGGDDYGSVAFIYDVNEQATTSLYTASHTLYTAPSSVRDAIATSSTPATWADDALRDIFVAASDSPSSNPTSDSSGGSDGASDEGGSNGLSGGAIAGIVIGAVAGIAIVVGIILFALRRKRRTEHEMHGKPELDATDTERKYPAPLVEAPYETQKHELDGTPTNNSPWRQHQSPAELSS